MPDSAAPALKEIFNQARYRAWAKELRSVYPDFNAKRFLAITLGNLESRSLLQRLRRTSEALRETLPPDFPKAVAVLREFAPRLGGGFSSLVLSDYVGLYGHEHYDVAMEALAHFTSFGSSEFAIREYLKRDLNRTLAVMLHWAESDNEHVRRLASEGSRPRLPWSFRLEAVARDPNLTAPVLAKLIDDPSLYVRKSVANHLNDISKVHPDWLIAWLRTQDLTRPRALWIAKRALRSLIKTGHGDALAMVGATGKAKFKVVAFTLSPKRVKLGQSVRMCFAFTATGKARQHVVIDYAVHYVKSAGGTSAKVFKWKAVDLDPRESRSLKKTQRIQDFTTRRHYAGQHKIDVLANGRVVATASFLLLE